MFKISVRFNDSRREDVTLNVHCFNVIRDHINIVTNDGYSFNYPRNDVYGIFLIPDIKN